MKINNTLGLTCSHQMKKILSLILSLTMLCTMITMFGVNASAKEITPTNDTGAGTGDSTLAMNGTAVPAPTYIVTIPETIAFGACDKAMANDTAENKIKTITLSDLTVNHTGLFANEKIVTVTVGSSFKMSDGGTDTLEFALSKNGTTLASGDTVSTINPTDDDANITDSTSLSASFDKSQIKKNNTQYTGTVTFTVTLSDAQ